MFPGGCFFATVAVQLASRPGRARDRVMEVQQRWLAQFTEALGQAVEGGELPRDTDIDQLVFEITAMMVRANFTWIVTGDTRVLDQARIGIRNVLERVVGQPGSKRQPSERRARRERLTLPGLRGERGGGVTRSMGEGHARNVLITSQQKLRVGHIDCGMHDRRVQDDSQADVTSMGNCTRFRSAVSLPGTDLFAAAQARGMPATAPPGNTVSGSCKSEWST